MVQMYTVKQTHTHTQVIEVIIDKFPWQQSNSEARRNKCLKLLKRSIRGNGTEITLVMITCQ